MVGGQNHLQGTVQICVGGVWGTVCGDGFGTLDAQVICRQLGFGTRGNHIKSITCVRHWQNEINMYDLFRN